MARCPKCEQAQERIAVLEAALKAQQDYLEHECLSCKDGGACGAGIALMEKADRLRDAALSDTGKGCPTCKGTGSIYQNVPPFHSFHRRTCSDCGGSGKVSAGTVSFLRRRSEMGDKRAMPTGRRMRGAPYSSALTQSVVHALADLTQSVVHALADLQRQLREAQEERDRLRALEPAAEHYPIERSPDVETCYVCAQPWPCDARLLMARCDAAIKRGVQAYRWGQVGWNTARKWLARHDDEHDLRKAAEKDAEAQRAQAEKYKAVLIEPLNDSHGKPTLRGCKDCHNLWRKDGPEKHLKHCILA